MSSLERDADAVTPTKDLLAMVPPQSKHDAMTVAPEKTVNRLSQEEIDDLLWTEAAYNKTLNGTVVQKRTNYLSWDDYFFSVAALSALRSKDPDDSTGACIVDWNNRIVGIGYTGFPRGCSDDCLPWTKESTTNTWLHTKSPFVVHAEVNAILNKCASDVYNTRLYCQTIPCNECSKVIIQSGISEVVYSKPPSGTKFEEDSKHNDDRIRASIIMLTMAGVKLRQYTPTQYIVHLDFWKNGVCHKAVDNKQQHVAAITSNRSKASYEFRDLLIKQANYDPLAQASTKREKALSWDDYFLAMALLSAQRSKDPNTQVGACIVDSNKRIIGLGYNGFPSGCSDDDLPWARQADQPLHTKYFFVCHAEVNAILNKGSADVRNSTLYVALFPCNECAKIIVQAGIAEVVYINDQYHDTDSCRASRIMFQMSGVRLRKHIPTFSSLLLELD